MILTPGKGCEVKVPQQMTIRNFRPTPTTMHPLMGASPGTLLRAYWQFGGVSGRSVPYAALFLLSSIARLPFSLVEKMMMGGASSQPGVEAPVFIVGHWRSGTTHLHNLLGCSPEFGFISPLASGLPGELLTLATWFRPWLEKALPETRGVDGVAVTPTSPQEDEIPIASMDLLSVFHALYFPQHFSRNFARGVFFEGVREEEIARWAEQVRVFHRKVVRHQGKAKILLKNPVYTARVKRLLEIWPDAKFVHIYRNPYDVYASTVHYFKKMIRELALQSVDELDVSEHVLQSYVRIMETFDREKTLLAEGQLCEVRYESLAESPLPELRRVYQELGLSGWSEFEPRVNHYLDTIRGYGKNRYDYPDDQCRLVEERWGTYLQRWGYQRPEKVS